jgi:hypothetical protein
MKKIFVLSLIFAFILAACGEKTENPSREDNTGQRDAAAQKAKKPKLEKPEGQEERIVVQHILIAFKGSGVPNVKRGKEEAEKLAEEVYRRAMKGEDFDELVKAYSNDRFPGIYPMVNFGVAETKQGENRREEFIPAFGDVGFLLKVGEIGLAPYDKKTSPYGWHIIRRIK